MRHRHFKTGVVVQVGMTGGVNQIMVLALKIRQLFREVEIKRDTDSAEAAYSDSGDK